jgi:lipopolysaccharide transport system ATP-binding protein
MSNPGPAIELGDVSKVYRLYPNRLELLLDISGLSALRFWRRPRYTEHKALVGVGIVVARGARVGLIGRNGAGKSTLLKLITRNFLPSSGSVRVNGTIQALMTAGLGFHAELTGAQNIRASLVYNGLSPSDMALAFEDVVEFAELGEYLHQPLKTYSLGMQSRLAFATATAIKPDILIIDEVLGAGDGYFAAKSAERMQKLTNSGLTLLLVSHSMPQIVQFCQQAIWLEQGQVLMEGEALEVVKAYEQFIRQLEDERLKRRNQDAVSSGALEQATCVTPVGGDNRGIPETASASVVSIQGAAEHEAYLERGATYVARQVSRWPGLGKLGLRSFRILDGQGNERAVFSSRETLVYEVEVANVSGASLPCIVAINTYLLDGKQVLLDWSAKFDVPASGSRVSLKYAPLYLGNGEYVVSIGLYRVLDMLDTSTAEYYDLWDRSFQFKVVTRYPLDASVLKPPSSWQIEGLTTFDKPALAQSRVVDSA